MKYLEAASRTYLQTELGLFFTNIYVELDKESDNASELMRAEKTFLVGKRLIHIQPRAFEEEINEFIIIFVHETVHLVHDEIANFTKKYDERSQRLQSLIDFKKYEDEPNVTADFIARLLRTSLLGFQAMVLSEGLAQFGMYYLTKDKTGDFRSWLKSSEEHFNVFYEQAIESTQEIAQQWKIIVSSKDDVSAVWNQLTMKNPNSFIKKIRGNEHPYVIGMHMVQATLFLKPELTFHDIIKMEPSRLFSSYEKAMMNAGKTPVISYVNNTGIFSYGKAIGELTSWIRE